MDHLTTESFEFAKQNWTFSVMELIQTKLAPVLRPSIVRTPI